MRWITHFARRREVASDPQALADLALLLFTALGWIFVVLILAGVIP